MSDSSGSSQSVSPPALDEDRFAPLKRNHACLQCKKRKVKCDATRPTCSPCMRSWAHASRAAQKHKMPPPELLCTYAEGDSAANSDDEGAILVDKDTRLDGVQPKRKRMSTKNVGEVSRDGKDVEKDQLLARIAELENRLNGLTPSDSNSSEAQPISRPDFHEPVFSTTPATGNYRPSMPGWDKKWSVSSVDSLPNANANSSFHPIPAIDTSTDAQLKNNGAPSAGLDSSATEQIPNLDFDLGGFFMVPANWPPGLPAPFLLEHLVETFFTHAPQLPRMIHRASLLTRLRLPPKHDDFPHPSLLHAICAQASSYTAWVNNVPPEMLEEVVARHRTMNLSLETIEDFALAQGEIAQRCIRNASSVCMMGPGTVMMEIGQACIILSEVYFNKGMPLQGWLSGCLAPRIIGALEMTNQHRANKAKEPLLTEPRDFYDREQRYATVWLAFVYDTGFALNSFWPGSFHLSDLYNPLPASADLFKGKSEFIPQNPQSARTPTVLIEHPVQDTFVMVSKASILMYRCAQWIRTWTQRDEVPGDELQGMSRPDFIELVNDIRGFQANLPASMRNVFKMLETPSTNTFDCDVLLLHILPNLSLALLYEPFLLWESPNAHCISQIQKCFEAILGILYMIPSNIDISLIFTSLTAFCVYTTGRIIANFVQHAIDIEQYNLAARFRADLLTCQSLLNRYAQKHVLGAMTSVGLEHYLTISTHQKLSARVCLEFPVDKNSEFAVPFTYEQGRPVSSHSTPRDGMNRLSSVNSASSAVASSSSNGPTPPVRATITPDQHCGNPNVSPTCQPTTSSNDDPQIFGDVTMAQTLEALGMVQTPGGRITLGSPMDMMPETSGSQEYPMSGGGMNASPVDRSGQDGAKGLKPGRGSAWYVEDLGVAFGVAQPLEMDGKRWNDDRTR